MVRPVEVRAVARYRIWPRYEDGTEGEVDLSHLAGKGVVASWEQEGVFALCPGALYLKLTGKRPEDVFTGLRATSRSVAEPRPC